MNLFNDLRIDPSLTMRSLNNVGGVSPTGQRGSAEDFAALMERTAARNTGSGSSALERLGLSAADPNSGSRRSTATPEIDTNSELFQLALELETFLVKNILTSMRNTVQRSGLIEQSFAGKIYEDMLWDEYARDFTRNAGFGLAEQAYLQLTRNQRAVELFG